MKCENCNKDGAGFFVVQIGDEIKYMCGDCRKKILESAASLIKLNAAPLPAKKEISVAGKRLEMLAEWPYVKKISS